SSSARVVRGYTATGPSADSRPHTSSPWSAVKLSITTMFMTSGRLEARVSALGADTVVGLLARGATEAPRRRQPDRDERREASRRAVAEEHAQIEGVVLRPAKEIFVGHQADAADLRTDVVGRDDAVEQRRQEARPEG